MVIVPNEDLVAQRNLILYIDIFRIEQVIRNLITNAVKIQIFVPFDSPLFLFFW